MYGRPILIGPNKSFGMDLLLYLIPRRIWTEPLPTKHGFKYQTTHNSNTSLSLLFSPYRSPCWFHAVLLTTLRLSISRSTLYLELKGLMIMIKVGEKINERHAEVFVMFVCSYANHRGAV